MVIDLEDIEQIIFPINVYRLVSESILENEGKIVNLNKQQLYSGYDANEKFITPEYTDYTIEKKIEKGQPFDRVTTYDEGLFHESIFLQPFGGEYEFNASDYKIGGLKEKYGEDILGISNSNLDNAAEIIKDTLIESYANELRK